MNFKHGFYSRDSGLNPDSVMMQNIEVKRALMDYEPDIKDYLDGEFVNPELHFTVQYLINCCLPHSDHLLPKGYQEKAREYWNSKRGLAFQKLLKEKQNEKSV